MTELQRLTVDEVAKRLAALRAHDVQAAPEPGVSESRWSFREAAALLGAFHAGSLRTKQDEPEAALREFVSRDCERVTTRDGSRWRLAAAVREETVRRMRAADRLLASLAESDPDPTDVGRAMAEAYLRGTAPPLDRQSFEELQGSLQAVEWLTPLELTLPTTDQVLAQLAIAGMLQPLRTLVGDHFVGRAKELRRLADYVEVLPPGSLSSSVMRRLRHVFNLAERPPIVIHGPGGVGKSTLVARFVLEHTDLAPERRFPFAYLSFDRADLIPHRPLTLLAEAVRQLGALYPQIAQSALSFEQSVRSTLLSYAAAEDERERFIKQKEGLSGLSRRDEHDLLGRLGGLVESAIGNNDLPYLWVLDTFEVAQRNGPRAIDRLWEFLNELQGTFPRLRVVFAGRAPLHGHPTDELPLGGLDDELAMAFLRNHLDGLSVTTKFLRSVAAQVGANPLSLKLAAELLRREGKKGLRSIHTRRRILFRLGEEEIQGLLYRRILDHLDDADLRRIANPGLTVRRVTPSVIADVLAVPCGLGRIDTERAWELFEQLKAEVSLVQVADDDAVVHRADVRRTMLPLLERNDAGLVRSIHRRAVRFYHDQPGIQARAEELYHRLALGQTTSTLDRYWDAEAGQLLEGSLDELPPAGRVYLADRLGLPIEADLLAEVEDKAWARQTARLAREMLDAGRAGEALELLRARRTPLAQAEVTPIEIETLATLGQVDEALSIVDDALVRATDEGRSAAFIKLAVLGARVAEDAGLFERALGWIEQARDVADALSDRIAYLRATTSALRLRRRSGAADSSTARRLRKELIEAARELSWRDRVHNPSLIRDLAAEIGAESPDLLLDATKLVGLDIEADAGNILEELLTSEQIEDFLSFVRERVDPMTLKKSEVDESVLNELVGQTGIEQGLHVSDYLTSASGSVQDWSDTLVRVYQLEADRPSFEASVSTELRRPKDADQQASQTSLSVERKRLSSPDPSPRRWVVYVQNASNRPIYVRQVLVSSDRFELTIRPMGTVPAGQTRDYELEEINFPPHESPPDVTMTFTDASGAVWRLSQGLLRRVRMSEDDTIWSEQASYVAVWVEWKRLPLPDPTPRRFVVYVQNGGNQPIDVRHLFLSSKRFELTIEPWETVPAGQTRDYELEESDFPPRKEPPDVTMTFTDASGTTWRLTQGLLRRVRMER